MAYRQTFPCNSTYIVSRYTRPRLEVSRDQSRLWPRRPLDAGWLKLVLPFGIGEWTSLNPFWWSTATHPCLC
jgi:hypothetical protein